MAERGSSGTGRPLVGDAEDAAELVFAICVAEVRSFMEAKHFVSRVRYYGFAARMPRAWPATEPDRRLASRDAARGYDAEAAASASS